MSDDTEMEVLIIINKNFTSNCKKFTMNSQNYNILIYVVYKSELK